MMSLFFRFFPHDADALFQNLYFFYIYFFSTRQSAPSFTQHHASNNIYIYMMHLCVVVVLLLCTNSRSTPTPNAHPRTKADVNFASPPLANNSPQSLLALQYQRVTHQKQHIAPAALPSSRNVATTVDVKLHPNGCSSHARILCFHCDYCLTMTPNEQGKQLSVKASKQQRVKGSQQHTTRDGESKHRESGKVWSNKGCRTKPQNAAEAVDLWWHPCLVSPTKPSLLRTWKQENRCLKIVDDPTRSRAPNHYDTLGSAWVSHQ